MLDAVTLYEFFYLAMYIIRHIVDAYYDLKDIPTDALRRNLDGITDIMIAIWASIELARLSKEVQSYAGLSHA